MVNGPLPRLSVLGTGYLGATHAVCMTELGYDVIGLDVDESKVARLAAGEVPFFEPGLPELLRKALDSGRLRFTTSYEEVAEFADAGSPSVSCGCTWGGRTSSSATAARCSDPSGSPSPPESPPSRWGLLYSVLFQQEIASFLPHVTVGLIMWALISGSILEGSDVFISATRD